jgi:hypothetical protein
MRALTWRDPHFVLRDLKQTRPNDERQIRTTAAFLHVAFGSMSTETRPIMGRSHRRRPELRTCRRIVRHEFGERRLHGKRKTLGEYFSTIFSIIKTLLNREE